MRKYKQGRKVANRPITDLEVMHAHTQREQVDGVHVYRADSLAAILGVSLTTLKTALKFKGISYIRVKGNANYYYLDEAADALEELS